jgi:hypothetical protein
MLRRAKAGRETSRSNKKINVKAHSILSFRFPMWAAVREKSPPQQAGFFKSLRPDAYMLHPDAGHST